MSIRTFSIHASLLILTFLTVTLAGVQWLNKDPFELSNFSSGLSYSYLLIAFLGTHEMGHYLAARAHKVQSTLPYFLPFPPFYGLMPFGTVGAVIRIRSEIRDKRALLDIGAAGPIAGFFVSILVLGWGMTHLPSIEYLYSIHPEYRNMSAIPESGLTFGKPIMYALIEFVMPTGSSFIPPMNEMYHYPFLCVGWFGMFVTALNLIPVGQLDGGHISFALFGTNSHRIAQTVLVFLTILGTAGFLPLIGIDFTYGWTGWLIWSLALALLLRNAKFRHSPMESPAALGPTRMILGWSCAAILVLTFIPIPVAL